jgi:Tfp pilus assembly protein PilO
MKTWKILFIVVIVSAIGFGVLPLKKSVAKLKAENLKLYETKQEKIAEYEEFTSNNAGEGEKIIDPELKIPRKLAQTELLIDLQKIASQTNTELPDSWSFTVTKDADLDISKLGVSFSIKGSRGDIYKFIKLVEQNERFLEIESFAIRTFNDNGMPTSEMPVHLFAYAQEVIEK